MKTFALLLAFSVSLSYSAVAEADQPAKPSKHIAKAQPPIDDLIARAKTEGKPLVIDFYAVWCKPCKKFKAEVLPTKPVQTALGDVIFHTYDAEKGNGKKAAKRFNVSGYPSFLVIDGNGKERARRMGFMPISTFVSFVHQSRVAVLDSAGVKSLLAKKGNDARTLLAVARWHRAKGTWKEADAIYQRAVRADPGNSLGVAGEAAWECMQLQRYHGARARIVRSNASFIKRFPTSKNAVSAFSQIALALPATERDQLADGLLPGIMKDAGRLNGAVYLFLAVGSLDAALKAAKQQVTLKPKDANPYDSLAETHHYRGEKQLAIAASNKGIALVASGTSPRIKAQRAELKRNLKRFSAPGMKISNDVAAAKYRAQTFLARLPGHDPVAQKLTRPKRPPSPRAAAFKLTRTFHTGARTNYSAAGKECLVKSGKLKELYIRVEFTDQTSRRAKKVVVLEPTASRALKRCLKRSIAKADFAQRPAQYKERYTSVLRFPTGNARLDAIMSAKKPKRAKKARKRKKLRRKK